MTELKTFSGRPASQNYYELTSFIKFLNENNVESYLEIGTRHGDTFHEVMINLPKGSRGLAVDLPGGLWGTSKSVKTLKRVIQALRGNYSIDYILGDSQKDKIIRKIKSLAPFDAALIDGDHTLVGVTKDWENYRGVAKYIAFHDIVGTGQKEKRYGRPVEVPLLWQDLKKKYKTVEFIDKNSAMGIGVVINE